MINDKQLIELFLRGYSEARGKTFHIVFHPDEVTRNEQAIDALAVADDGTSLAIEHTLIEPFEGERADAQAFMRAFSALERDPSLILANYDVTLSVPAFAVRVGTDWDRVGVVVVQWFRDSVAGFPEGDSDQTIPGLPFPLQVHVAKTRLEDVPGYNFIARTIPANGLGPVIRRALERKLPKLLESPADRRLLLMERQDAAYGYSRICDEIEQAKARGGIIYPDEIWLATSLSWDQSRNLWLHELWPDFRRSYFYLTAKDDKIVLKMHARN